MLFRSVTSYGEYENENYVWILENFSNSSAPPNPVTGQLWYNSSTDVISSYSSANTWVALATRSYVDNEIAASKVDPTLTGNVTITGNAIVSGYISATGNITTAGTLIANTVLAGSIVTTGTSTAFRLPNLSQSQINLLSPQNGDMVYNTTSNYPQVYQNGSWQIFTLSYYS